MRVIATAHRAIGAAWAATTASWSLAATAPSFLTPYHLTHASHPGPPPAAATCSTFSSPLLASPRPSPSMPSTWHPHASRLPPPALHARPLTSSPLRLAEMRFPVPRRLRDLTSNKKRPLPVPKPQRPDPTLGPLERIDPLSIPQQTQLTLHGQPITGDPGSTRWGAPYYIPPALQQGVLPVLLADPWPSVQDQQLRREHAQLLVSFLRDQAPKRLTGAEIMEQLHAQQGPTFGSLPYVRQLLEHLRTARMIRGANNPAERVLGPGSKHYPLLYYATKYQQEEYGSPLVIARRKAAEHEAAVAHALKRVRRRKSPYPIHRRRAFDSALHWELGQEQVRQALQQQQEQRQMEEWKTSLSS